MMIETPELKLQFDRCGGNAQEFGNLFVTDKATGDEYVRSGVLLVDLQRMLNRATKIVRSKGAEG